MRIQEIATWILQTTGGIKMRVIFAMICVATLFVLVDSLFAQDPDPATAHKILEIRKEMSRLQAEQEKLTAMANAQITGLKNRIKELETKNAELFVAIESANKRANATLLENAVLTKDLEKAKAKVAQPLVIEIRKPENFMGEAVSVTLLAEGEEKTKFVVTSIYPEHLDFHVLVRLTREDGVEEECLDWPITVPAERHYEFTIGVGLDQIRGAQVFLYTAQEADKLRRTEEWKKREKARAEELAALRERQMAHKSGNVYDRRSAIRLSFRVYGAKDPKTGERELLPLQGHPTKSGMYCVIKEHFK
jgi:hypothetical protein